MVDVQLALAPGRRPTTGHAGITHCGSWVPVTPGQEYGWLTRVVCNREPAHPGRHRTSNGLRWSRSNPTPRRPA